MSLAAGLDQHLHGLIGDAPDDIRSAVVRLETLDGALLYEGAAGQARPDTGAPMTPQTPFHHASIGKTYTAVLILQLLEQGALGPDGLDAPLARFGLFAPDTLNRIHAIAGQSHASAITLRQLLTHTAGIKDAMSDDRDGTGGPAPGSLIGRMMGPSGDRAQAWVAWDPARADDAQAGVINFYINEGIGETALSLPGTRFHYSDTGFMILALLAQHLGGQSYAGLLAERIFAPLGLHKTYLAYAADPVTMDAARSSEAEVYAHGTPCLSQGVSLAFDWGGGGTVSTAADLVRFLRGLVAGRLFKRADTYAAMTQWLVPDGLMAPRLGVGLGFFRLKSSQGELWGHTGAWGAKMLYDPHHGIVFAGTINQSAGPGNWHWPFIAAAIA
jgi:D-alanyl-D-alanine carboxypeptidase